MEVMWSSAELRHSRMISGLMGSKRTANMARNFWRWDPDSDVK